MVSMPIPDRILLNSTGTNRAMIFRDVSRWISADLGLHPVGVYEFLTTPDQGGNETRLLPGLLILDGCLTGIAMPYTAIVRLAHPTAMGIASPYPVEVIIISISPDTDHSGHVQRMNRLTRLLKRSHVMGAIKSAMLPDDVMALFLVDDATVRAA